MDLYRTFINYFISGGVELMVPIFAVSVVAWYIALEKLGQVNRLYRFRKKYLKRIKEVMRGEGKKKDIGYYPYDLLVDEVQMLLNGEKRDAEILYSEFLVNSVPDVNKHLATISTWTSVAPLLGLLGTVTGMIATFKVITDYGLGNPGLTAQGISVALLTTQAGLTVAFPMVMMHNYLANRSNHLLDNLRLDGEHLVNSVKERVVMTTRHEMK